MTRRNHHRLIGEQFARDLNINALTKRVEVIGNVNDNERVVKAVLRRQSQDFIVQQTDAADDQMRMDLIAAGVIGQMAYVVC